MPGAMTLEFYLVAAVAVVLTGISKSGFAGGLGILAVPMMSLFQTPQVAVTVMMPILLVMDCANIWKYRAAWSAPVVASLLPGALCGIALGAVSFQWMNPALLKLAIGVMAILFVVQFVLTRARQSAPRAVSPGIAFGLGALSGFASFVAHAGGPPVKGYLLSRQMEKSEFVGTNSFFFFAVNLVKMVSYAGLAQFSLETLKISALLVPFLVLGVLLGFQLHRSIGQSAFTRIAYVILAVAGTKLIWDAVPASLAQ